MCPTCVSRLAVGGLDVAGHPRRKRTANRLQISSLGVAPQPVLQMAEAQLVVARRDGLEGVVDEHRLDAGGAELDAQRSSCQRGSSRRSLGDLLGRVVGCSHIFPLPPSAGVVNHSVNLGRVLALTMFQRSLLYRTNPHDDTNLSAVSSEQCIYKRIEKKQRQFTAGGAGPREPPVARTSAPTPAPRRAAVVRKVGSPPPRPASVQRLAHGGDTPSPSKAGMRTVVSGGNMLSTPGMSSKPTTLTSCGIRTPMLMQRAGHDAHGLAVVRGDDHAGRQTAAASTPDARRG